MLFDPLDRVLGSVTKVRLLRVLLHLTEPLSGREAQTRAGVKTRNGASDALNELSELGIVRRVEIRSSNLYAINDDHDLTRELRDLFATEERRVGEFITALQALLATAKLREAVVTVILYGSNARRAATPQSDVDLLVVVGEDGHASNVKEAFYAAAPELRSRFGIRISPYVLSAGEVADRERAGDPFVRAIRTEGRVLWGEPLHETGNVW